MKIDMEFKGLEELVKAFESAASDEDIAGKQGDTVQTDNHSNGVH